MVPQYRLMIDEDNHGVHGTTPSDAAPSGSCQLHRSAPRLWLPAAKAFVNRISHRALPLSRQGKTPQIDPGHETI